MQVQLLLVRTRTAKDRQGYYGAPSATGLRTLLTLSGIRDETACDHPPCGCGSPSSAWPRVVAPPGLFCCCCSHSRIHRSALCRLTLLRVSPEALFPPFGGRFFGAGGLGKKRKQSSEKGTWTAGPEVSFAKRSALSKRTRTLGHYHTEPY